MTGTKEIIIEDENMFKRMLLTEKWIKPEAPKSMVEIWAEIREDFERVRERLHQVRVATDRMIEDLIDDKMEAFKKRKEVEKSKAKKKSLPKKIFSTKFFSKK